MPEGEQDQQGRLDTSSPTKLIDRAKQLVERARAASPLLDVAVGTFQRYSADDAGSYAAALTYYGFFSIFPLLLVAAAVLGYVISGDPEMQEELIRNGVKTVPILRDAFSPDGIKTVIASRHKVAVTGLLLALYSGSGAVVALEHALNKLHHLSDEPGFLAKRIRSLRWLAFLAVGGVVSLAMGAASGFAADLFGGGTVVEVTTAVLASVLGVAVNCFVFATAFRYLPAVVQPWRAVVPGAIVAGIGFQILNFAGTAYLAHGETARNDTFGTFAAAATLLVASYLIAQLTLLAAEVNLVLAERRGGAGDGAI